MGKDSQILVPIMCLHKHKHSPYPSAHFCINGVPLSFEFLIIIFGGGGGGGWGEGVANGKQWVLPQK